MAKSKHPRRDIYQEITDRILEYLESGNIPPWRHPITKRGGGGMPKNLTTGKQYRGINIFLLAITSWMKGYESSYWLTFNQAKDWGGMVKKGEKSTLVTFWKEWDREDKETGDIDKVPVLRHYAAFNVEQCEGIDAPDVITDADLIEFNVVAAAESIVRDFRNPPAIEHGGGRACYIRSSDKIEIAKPERFRSAEDYYATLFHELTHATGHEKRLHRQSDDNEVGGHVFGSPAYAKEELVAEFGSAILCGHAGISPPTIENSVAYIKGWRAKIKADKKLVVQAAGKAQAAVDHILGTTFDAVATATTQVPERASTITPASPNPDDPNRQTMLNF